MRAVVPRAVNDQIDGSACKHFERSCLDLLRIRHIHREKFNASASAGQGAGLCPRGQMAEVTSRQEHLRARFVQGLCTGQANATGGPHQPHALPLPVPHRQVQLRAP